MFGNVFVSTHFTANIVYMTSLGVLRVFNLSVEANLRLLGFFITLKPRLTF